MSHLRLISYNCFKGRAWWSGRSVLDRMAATLRAQKADLVFLQEFRGSHRNVREWHERFQQQLEVPFGYYGKNFVSERSDHGNAVYSQLPLTQHGNHDLTISKLERRGLLCAQAQLPGSSDELFLFCTHLDLSESNREQQIRAIVEHIEKLLPHPDTPFILAGDFNDWQGQADYALRNHFGVKDAFHQTSGRFAKSFPSVLPILTLDRVYLRGFDAVRTRVLSDGFRTLSDHLPLQVDIERVR